MSSDWLSDMPAAGSDTPDLQIEDCLRPKTGVVIYRADLEGRAAIVEQRLRIARAVHDAMDRPCQMVPDAVKQVVGPISTNRDVLVMEQSLDQPGPGSLCRGTACDPDLARRGERALRMRLKTLVLMEARP